MRDNLKFEVIEERVAIGNRTIKTKLSHSDAHHASVLSLYDRPAD